jgi:hypothetical protein
MQRLTYANVVATLALFVALGGTSYAALTVTGAQVRDGSLSGRDVRRGSLSSAQIKDGSLLKRDFKAGQLSPGPAGAQGSQGPQGPQGLQGVAGAPGSDAANIVLAHVTTAGVGSGSSYGGIAAAAGLSTATTVTDVQSLETGNRNNATVTPVALRASDLVVSGDVLSRPVTVSLTAQNAATPYLKCTLAANVGRCSSEASSEIPAGTRLLITVNAPTAAGAIGGMAFAIGWRATPIAT